MESREIFCIFSLGQTHICSVVMACSVGRDLENVRQLLGKVRVVVKGSGGLYYSKHKTHTWISKSHKVAKTLVLG